MPPGVESIKSNSSVSVYTTSALFFLGIAASIFYKRIPGIRRFKSKTARVLWSFFFIFIPSGTFAAFWNKYTAQDMQLKFMTHRENFGSYIATRDITKLNPGIRMTDD